MHIDWSSLAHWIMWRLGIEELCARPFIEFVHPDDVASTVAAAGRIGEGGIVVTFENRYRTADGSYLQRSPKRTHFCSPKWTHVTELKRLERRQHEQLAREAHQQGSLEMAAGILHDLGNAFAGIGTRAVGYGVPKLSMEGHRNPAARPSSSAYCGKCSTCVSAVRPK